MLSSGDRIAISAEFLNKVQRSVQEFGSRQFGEESNSLPKVPSGSMVTVYNTGDVILERFCVVELVSFEVPRSSYPIDPIFLVKQLTEESKCFAVLQQTLAPGEVGMAAVSGVTLAHWTSSIGNHAIEFGTPVKSGGFYIGHLNRGAEGPFHFLCYPSASSSGNIALVEFYTPPPIKEYDGQFRVYWDKGGLRVARGYVRVNGRFQDAYGTLLPSDTIPTTETYVYLKASSENYGPIRTSFFTKSSLSYSEVKNEDWIALACVSNGKVTQLYHGENINLMLFW